MRFLAIYHPESGDEGGQPDAQHMAAMKRLTDRERAAGHLLATEPLAPPEQGARVRLGDGGFTVLQETERAGGYAILNADSLEDAIEQAKAFLEVAGPGVSEVRQILETPAQPSSSA